MKITVCKAVKIGQEMETRDHRDWTESILVGSDEPFGPEYKFHTFVIVGNEAIFFYQHRERKDDIPDAKAAA